ncbi:MAG: YfcC family protein, partial [Sporomusa sp.]
TFLLVIGGTFGIFKATGAIDALIARIITIFKGKVYERWIFVVLFSLFYTCSAIFGLSEEGMVFVPFIVSMSIALGYDAVLGLAVMLFSAALGYAAALTNPFNVGIAQAIAGLPMYSGLWYRLIAFVVILVVTCWYMLRYADKIKKDPSKSLVADIDYSHIKIVEDPTKVVMTNNQKVVVAAFVGAFACMIFTIIKWHFWLDQLTCVFLAIALLVGIVARMSPNEIAENFVEGAKTLVFAAVLVGIARGIQTVMESGLILDSIINAMVQPFNYLPSTTIAPFMVLVQSIINMVIPSSSAMAVVTMPIMSPMADVLGIQRQTACLAYQFGDGITNLILPYWPTLVIGIGMSGVPFQRWFKFALPLVGIILVIALGFVIIAEFIKIGPF